MPLDATADAVDYPDTIAVLHVDDDPSLAELTAVYLEREDPQFDVRSATSVAEAEELLASGRCDCIVSDYDMPERTGIEFLADVREDHPDLPFILYTGKGSEEVASDAISTGVTDYLQKETGSGQYAVLANRIRNAVEQYRAALSLETSQRRLSLFVDQSPLGVLEYNEAFEIVRLNEVGEEILGYSEEELLGETWEVLVTEESYANVDQITDELSEVSGGYHSVDENVRGDGERIVCEWHNRIITDDDGEAVSIVSLFQDVTDRRERERELERYKAYIEGSSDVVTVLDEDGTVRYQSPSVTRVLGYDPGELVGKNAFDFVHPDDRADSAMAFEQLLEGPERRAGAECRFRTADGDWLWLDVRGTDYRDNPDLGDVVVNSRDISDRKAREQRLEQTSARLELLFDESPDMINVHDADGNILEPNRRLCEETGYSADELTDLKVWELDADISKTEAEALWSDLDAGVQRRLEGRFRRKDGSTFPVEVHIRRHTVGGEERFVVISRDITERKRQEAQLEQFATVVSHDLRNPLNVAEGRLELLRAETESEHLDALEKAHDRMNALIEDLLTLAQSGDQLHERERVDLVRLTERCWETVDTADAALEHEGDVTVWADRSRLRQLLENLVRNAIEHGGESVTVTVGELDDGFYVEDDGEGIDASGDESVFEFGYSTRPDGTGFGLSIVQRVAEAHGWDLRLTTSESGGARFEFTGVDRPDASAHDEK